ncbi:MAG: DUF819 family protein [Cytophagales bacterium]|nr:DUF819 family protein [Cytophagales bacterium]
MVSNDAVIFGLLMLVLGLVFTTAASDRPGWKRFYSVVPAVLVCYLMPSLLSTFGVIDISESRLYFVASRYLLPASLVLLTLSIDLKELLKLGPKALIIFLTGTLGIMLGGPITLLIFSAIPQDIIALPPTEEMWRGLTTVAGSWIGGGANQAAMKEVFEVGNDLFAKFVTVDIIVGNIWIGTLLVGVGYNKKINKFLKADESSIVTLKEKMEDFQERVTRLATTKDLMNILMVGFAATAVGHFLSDIIAPAIKENFPALEQYSLTSGFFWLVVIATTIGLGLSFTRLRDLEGAGASKVGSVFVYVLVTTIGMQMDLFAIFENPGLFLVGITWMLFHVGLMVLVAWLIKAPYFFVGVGSTANVGGAASAPIVAAAFHPSLAPVGVLLAVMGYVVGTYGAYLCGIMMQAAAQ